ncbi:MAG: deoxyribose-phosphate aldolase [Planctomycetota bacterium]
MARRIEHTLLRPEAARTDIELTLSKAVAWGCHGVCVQPYWVALLRDAPLPVISVAGFPFGAEPQENKARAAARAVDDGASEIDIVLNLGALKSGDLAAVAADVAAVRRAIPGRVLKVILETGLLDPAEIATAARICMEEGADFLKTCTGYGPRGATVEDVRVLKAFGPVKAAAGIRTFAQAVALVEAGAARLGTSATSSILAPVA